MIISIKYRILFGITLAGVEMLFNSLGEVKSVLRKIIKADNNSIPVKVYKDTYTLGSNGLITITSEQITSW